MPIRCSRRSIRPSSKRAYRPPQRTSQGALDGAKAQLGTAQDQSDQTVLKAGAAGFVTARVAEAGQVVQSGQTVYTLAQDGPRDAVFDVYEAFFVGEPA